MTAIASGLPLFARATRAHVESLVVRRYEDGRWIRAPKAFRVEELPDRDAVRARFGGGRYEVIGRDARRIAARTRFVIDGPSLALEEPDAPRTGKRAPSGLRRFATPAGERESLVFRLLREGLGVQEITEQTGIESRIVRGIYLSWLTPTGGSLPATHDEIAALERDAERRAIERELAAWDL